MINLKKVGLTALAGSLAAVTAQAGELSVTGSANVTLKNGGADHVARAIGTDKDVKFSGSGELDNGWTFAIHTLTKDDLTVSSTATVITMGSMGSIGFGTGGGTNVAGAYDETYPRAYEETSDAGGDSSSNYLGSWADDNAVVYQFPAMEFMGASVSGGLEYSLQAGSPTANDGGTIARSNVYGEGYGLGVTIGYEGLSVGAYVAERDNKNQANVADIQDEFNGTWFANYSMGPIAIGYQKYYVDGGLTVNTDDNTTTNAKTVGTSSGHFEGDSMSIAFNVNDDLSISYAESDDTHDAGSVTTTSDVTQSSDSLQIAYSMGAMSVKAYATSIKNPNYDEDARDLSINEVALGLSF
jgi:outer membrane protein OmpU